MLRKLILAFALLLAPTVVTAQDDANSARIEQRAQDIVAALKQEMPVENVFTDSFNQAVSEAQLNAITSQLTGQFGPLVGVESLEAVGQGGARITLRFERGLANGEFQLEPTEPYEVAGFRLTDFEPLDTDPASLLQEFEALPGETAVFFAPLDGGEPLLAYNPDAQFAIGSTFKLYVLSALAHSVAEGDRAWSDVVELSQRSYPSGQMRDFPQGAPVTLHTLATLMIANSDNTATDQLITELGREAVEAELAASGHAEPPLSLPFLTTREMFLLKAGAGDAIDTYGALSDAERREVLAGLEEAGASLTDDDIGAAFASGPNNIDVEWFASARDIARIFDRIRALEDDTALRVLAVNTAMPERVEEQWRYVGYKGGSEPGVLNLSWLLQDTAGTWHVLAMSWNNPDAAVDQQAFELLSQRVVALAETGA